MTESERKALAADVAELLAPVIVQAFRHFRRTTAKTEGLMSLSQAADLLGMSPKRLIVLRKSGRVRGVLLPGSKHWRYRRADLERFAEGPRI